MIEVKHLTKKYGKHTAVEDLSFSVDKGMIYGFLGPNGAGKSTTMNILTGCLGASDGEVLIDGHNIMDEPMLAKQHIGYLPEIPPLYVDMTVEEYLRFVAAAKGLNRGEKESQLLFVMEKTRITDMRRRLIRNLSKGYRQRVGIAQALLGNPEIIILDEPTVGLDPKQIIEIREMIRELGREHTVILSSHILSEVQAVCDSILILSHGNLVASDTPENLTLRFAGETTYRLEAKCGKEQAEQVLEGLEGIRDVRMEAGEDGTMILTLTPEEGMDARESIFFAFARAGIALMEMRLQKASLEDIFLELTQDVQADEALQPRKPGKEETQE